MREASTSTRALWMMLLLPPVSLLAVIVGFMVVAGVPPTDPEAEPAVRGALPYLLAVNHLALFALLLWVLRRRGAGLGDIGWRLEPLDTTVGRELAVGVVCALGLYLFKELGYDSLEALLLGRTPTFTSLFNFHLEAAEIPMAVAATSLVFVEESIYRGFAVPGLERRHGRTAAVVLSSVCFGFLHWGNGPTAVAFATVWGVLLAGIFLWRGSLVAGTVAHALYNLAVVST